MAMTERDLLYLLARMKELHTDLLQGRPAIAAVDDSWDETLSHMDEAISAFGLAVYLGTEALADTDAIEAGDKQQLPSGEMAPMPQDPRT